MKFFTNYTLFIYSIFSSFFSYTIEYRALNDQTKEIVTQYTDAIILYLQASDNWPEFRALVTNAVEGNIRNLDVIEQNPGLDFFQTNIKRRPMLYSVIEKNEDAFQRFMRENPDKNHKNIKELRSQMRKALHYIFLHIYQYASQVRYAKELLTNFYQENFLDDKAKMLVQKSFDADQQYYQEVGYYPPLIDYLGNDTKKFIAIIESIDNFEEIDFFVLDMNNRLNFYNDLETHYKILQQYKLENPEKDMNKVYQVRDEMREAFNAILLFMDKNRNKISLMIQLYKQLYNYID